MLKTYTPEEFWKIYEKLPADLQEALFSDNVTDDIFNICERYGITNREKFNYLIGHVLMGLLPPDNFAEFLSEELSLDEKTSKKISVEVERFIFYPYKNSLSQLYKIEFTPLPTQPLPPSFEEKKETSLKNDKYRETIEGEE